MEALIKKTIKDQFGINYKRKRSISIIQTGTAGFYPERGIYGLLNSINIVYPQYFEGQTFIDIGCGIGNILYAIYQFGFKGSIAGIEIDGDLLKIARKILPPNIKLIHGDARNYSFAKFDRVYTFNPFQMKPGLSYRLIWETLKPKTIWLEAKMKYMPKWLLKHKRIIIPRLDKNSPAILLFKG